MAIFCPPPTPTYPKPQPFPTFNPLNSSSLPFSVHPLRVKPPPPPPPPPLPSTTPKTRLRPCLAALSPPPPPQSDPPPEIDPQGVAATLSQLQDRVQIFLAVLFWMSLFFWACLWDGNDNGRGRLNKGSRFRKMM